MAPEGDGLVSVALLREDLRLLLVAASNWLDANREQGCDNPRLAQAIDRISLVATFGLPLRGRRSRAF
jgi:hypothetical protein